jgi:hypothetical protein
MSDNGSGPNYATISDGDPTANRDVTGDPTIITDRNQGAIFKVGKLTIGLCA